MKKIFIILLTSFMCLKVLSADGVLTNETDTGSGDVKEGEEVKKEAENESKSESEKESEIMDTGVIDIFGESAIIMEAETGKVLFEKNSETPYAPASMTKIMTLLLVMEEIEKGNITYEDQVTIGENAANMGGSQVYLEAGSVMSVKDLITAVAIGSANDATVALAEKVGGTVENFVKMMNDKARELGCTTASFKNPHGLDEEGHKISAKDLAVISRELIKHEDILKLTSTYEATLTHQNGKSIWLVNTNSLIKFYSGLDGLKTGYTENAGYCLTGTMERNGMRLITVVMKAGSKEERNTDTINMMEYAFSMFYKNVLLDKKKALGEVFIDNGEDRLVKYYLKDNVSVILGKDRKKIDYKYDIKLDDIEAPIKKNGKIGVLTLHFDEEDVDYDLVVNESIKKSGFVKRMINYFKDILSGNVSIF